MLLGASAEIAEDAAQDVFVVAYRRLSDFDPRDSPRGWLYAIAQRVVSAHRRGWRRRMRLLEQARSIESEPTPTPFELTAESEAHDVLRSELLKLPEAQRVAFVLSDMEELSVPQIAAALGVNVNTVYSRLGVARRTLSARLRRREPREPKKRTDSNLSRKIRSQ